MEAVTILILLIYENEILFETNICYTNMKQKYVIEKILHYKKKYNIKILKQCYMIYICINLIRNILTIHEIYFKM